MRIWHDYRRSGSPLRLCRVHTTPNDTDPLLRGGFCRNGTFLYIWAGSSFTNPLVSTQTDFLATADLTLGAPLLPYAHGSSSARIVLYLDFNQKRQLHPSGIMMLWYPDCHLDDTFRLRCAGSPTYGKIIQVTHVPTIGGPLPIQPPYHTSNHPVITAVHGGCTSRIPVCSITECHSC